MRTTTQDDKVPVKWVAFGYLGGYNRLKDATLKAYGGLQPNKFLAEIESGDVFITVFETLNWLNALLDGPEVAPLVEQDLVAAVGFVRGRVHHRWAEAIEFRNDVLLPPPPLGVRRGLSPPVVIADWCWKRAKDIPGGKRHGLAGGEREYCLLLEGRQTRAALDQIASVAGQLMAQG